MHKEYIILPNISSPSLALGGLGKKSRQVLAKLLRIPSGVISVEESAKILGVSKPVASRLLCRLAGQGWLARARRGVYIPICLEAQSAQGWPEDLWVLAAQVFVPCYIGGWSAAEHWNLTEQIFRTTLAITKANTRNHNIQMLGSNFRVKTVRPHKFFGTLPIWRGAVRLEVSDLQKTIVDMLDDPSIGGGIRTVAEMLQTYWHREDKNLFQILDYAKRMNNGAILKRLGYLAEHALGDDNDFLEACKIEMTAGNAMLDPSVKRKGRLLRRWRLWVNVDLSNL